KLPGAYRLVGPPLSFFPTPSLLPAPYCFPKPRNLPCTGETQVGICRDHSCQSLIRTKPLRSKRPDPSPENPAPRRDCRLGRALLTSDRGCMWRDRSLGARADKPRQVGVHLSS